MGQLPPYKHLRGEGGSCLFPGSFSFLENVWDRYPGKAIGARTILDDKNR